MDSLPGDLFSYLPTITVALICLLITKHYFGLLAKRRGLPPGPVTLPFIGSLYALPRDLSERPFEFRKFAKKYGGVFSFQAPTGGNTVILTDVEAMKQAFVKGTDCASRPYPRYWSQSIMNPFFPDAAILFNGWGEQLKFQRNTAMVVMRSLGYGKKSTEYKILDEADHLVAAFKEFKGASFSPKPFLETAVANIICSLLFGGRYQYGDKEIEELQHSIDKILEFLTTCRMLDTFPLLRYFQKKKIREYTDVCKILNDFTTRKVEEAKRRMEDGEESFNFISAYLEEISKTEGKVKDRSHQLVKDFFVAGSETTASAIGWILYFMIKYPDVQKKVRDEINSVVAKGDKPMLKDREKMPYIEATITEVLRAAPTAPFTLPHEAVNDTEIQGYKIPKHTTISGLIIPSNWDEKVFPDPHVIKPERHLDAQGQFVRHEKLIPFGVGRRSCLGEQLARQELFLFVSNMIQNLEFKVPAGETLPPQKGKWFITYKPPPYKLTVSAI